MKEVTGVIPDDLYAKICVLYEYVVIHKDPPSDIRLTELIGEIIKTGFPKLLKDRNIRIGYKKEIAP